MRTCKLSLIMTRLIFFVVAVHLISSPSSCLVAYQLRTLLTWRRNVSVNARKNYKNMKYVDEHNKNACGDDNTTSIPCW